MPPKRRPKPITWENALDQYEQHLSARRASPRTIEDRRRDLRHLQRRLDDLPLPEVTLADLRAHQSGLLTGTSAAKGRPLSAGAVARVATTIRSFFAFLTEEELLATDPALRLERPRAPLAQVGDVLSVPEVTRVLRAADPGTARGLRDRLVVEVLYATGLRRAELLALDLHDVDHDHRDLIVRRGKGEKPRRVPLTRSAWEFLERYLAEARPALASRHADSARALLLSYRGRRYDHTALVKLLRRLRKAARLTKKLGPHVMRRTCASHLLASGASLRHIQLLLGHARLSTTAVYLRIDTKEMRREVFLKHPRERIDA